LAVVEPKGSERIIDPRLSLKNFNFLIKTFGGLVIVVVILPAFQGKLKSLPPPPLK